MPVLGADPAVTVKEFPDFTPTVFVSRPVRSLVNYFGYHKGMTMSQRFTEKDKAILGRFFSQSLKKGFTDDTLQSIVDKFWQTWGADTQVPALTFVSHDMQDLLQQSREIEVSDVVLKWLLDGMPDDGPFSNSKAVRRIVLIGSRGLELRYPDVVATVLKEDTDEEWCVRVLRTVNDMVKWNLGEIDDRPDIGWFSEIELPYELTTNAKSPTKIRDKRDTINRAIATIPRKK